jgi:ATP-binding cassette subfamily B protein
VYPATADITAGARFAQADSFVRRLPAGYRTSLTDAPLSGGEAQRLGLARAFAHDSRVLVLEDVAASLDTVTEHLIQHVLTGRLKGRTRVVVARRASTAAAMDVVAWLERGRLRAVAPHDRLWDDPAYRALFQGQS